MYQCLCLTNIWFLPGKTCCRDTQSHLKENKIVFNKVDIRLVLWKGIPAGVV